MLARPAMGSARWRGLQHLEGKLGHAVSEPFQRQVLEHDIGNRSISRHLPLALDRLDQRVWLLVLAATIDAVIDILQRERLTIRPDPVDTLDLTFTDRHRKAQAVAIARHRRPALASGVLAAGLTEARRPYHLAAHPRAAIDIGNARPFPALGQVYRLKPRAFTAGREQGRIDGIAGNGAGRTPDRCAAKRAAKQVQAAGKKARTCRRARLGQYDPCHLVRSPVQGRKKPPQYAGATMGRAGFRSPNGPNRHE